MYGGGKNRKKSKNDGLAFLWLDWHGKQNGSRNPNSNPNPKLNPNPNLKLEELEERVERGIHAHGSDAMTDRAQYTVLARE